MGGTCCKFFRCFVSGILFAFTIETSCFSDTELEAAEAEPMVIYRGNNTIYNRRQFQRSPHPIRNMVVTSPGLFSPSQAERLANASNSPTWGTWEQSSLLRTDEDETVDNLESIPYASVDSKRVSSIN